MLAIGFFLAAASLPFSYAATATSQLLLDASDPSLVFSAGWTTQFSNASGSDYLQTDTVLGSLTASLPGASPVLSAAPAAAGGSSYGYTVDCQNDCILTTVSATDPSAGNPSFVQASTLFSLNLDPSFEHILRVYNIPSNLPGGHSEITFDHLAVDVQDNAQGGFQSSNACFFWTDYICVQHWNGRESIKHRVAFQQCSRCTCNYDGGNHTDKQCPKLDITDHKQSNLIAGRVR
ncbi:unnamed protein product [Mycena citricolor]|uniref:Uncharacterized protein n=1 Tax=Mycena citricolor TaxID=2018698 RepID=A0AAD2Q611_9AGAR|nr:unnamed protein product [Mycena citricolor]